MKVTIKLGGFIFPSNLESEVIQLYAAVIKKLSLQGHRLVIITGGGDNARKYIKVARDLGASECFCDILGIEITRLNARLLITALGENVYPETPDSITVLRKVFQNYKIVVAGGMYPAQSTNAVAALSAEAIGADLFINATSVDGVYTVDPKKDQSAKKLDVIKTEELMKIILSGRIDAGSYELFDPLAVKIVDRSGIPTRIINGQIPENIERVVNGEKLGTLILATRRK